jgi:hypothetical protein
VPEISVWFWVIKNRWAFADALRRYTLAASV